MFFFQNASHKIFRWCVPLALLVMLGVGAADRSPVGRAFFIAQLVFYGCAVLGFLLGRRRKAPWFLSIPAYFLAVNSAGLLAWAALFRDYTIWTPPTREDTKAG